MVGRDLGDFELTGYRSTFSSWTKSGQGAAPHARIGNLVSIFTGKVVTNNALFWRKLREA